MREVFKICVILFLGFFAVKLLRTNQNVINSLNLKKMTDGDTIHIHGLGKFKQSTLINTKLIIEDVYNKPVVIGEPYDISDVYRYGDGSINGHMFIEDYDSNSNKIFITKEKIISDNDGNEIHGCSEQCGNIMLLNQSDLKTIKTVLIHEISHNEGMGHCDNPKCVMYFKVSKDNLNSDFCDDCKKKL